MKEGMAVLRRMQRKSRIAAAIAGWAMSADVQPGNRFLVIVKAARQRAPSTAATAEVMRETTLLSPRRDSVMATAQVEDEVHIAVPAEDPSLKLCRIGERLRATYPRKIMEAAVTAESGEGKGVWGWNENLRF